MVNVRTTSRNVRFIRVAASVLAAWVVCAPSFSLLLITSKEVEKPDAILVLAGSAVYKERNSRAAELFLRGVAPKVILTDDGNSSGWSARDGRNVGFVELAKRELMTAGVPEDKIVVLDGTVGGTIDEARLIAARAESLGLGKILLVTSAYHSARALRTCEAVAAQSGKQIDFGMDAVEPGIETPRPLTWWLSVRGWKLVAGEWAKSAYYLTQI